jgi:pseudouridine synthase
MFVPRRLAKYVRDCTALSVREIRDAWSEARIRLETPAGEPIVATLDSRVFEHDRVRFDGRPLLPRSGQQVSMLHKPVGVTCTRRDPGGKADLGPWLRLMPEGMFPIGRLDRDTSGLLLFGTDGDLINCLCQPRHQTLKRYQLWIDETLDPDDPRLLAMTTPGPGYDSARHVTAPVPVPCGSELILTLDEGKNRQIRRLCYALRFRLLSLHRLSIGPIALGSLPVGEFRLLEAAEVEALWDSSGGRASTRQAQLAALHRDAAGCRSEGRPDHRLEAWLAALA